MSYYANGGGVLCLKTTIPDEIGKKLSDIFQDVGDSPDGGLWLTFEFNKYDDDTMRDAMEMVAPYAKSGSVEFCGEDGERWRFYFYDGKVRYENGRTVYEPVRDWIESLLEDGGYPSQDEEKLIEMTQRYCAIMEKIFGDRLGELEHEAFDYMMEEYYPEITSSEDEEDEEDEEEDE